MDAAHEIHAESIARHKRGWHHWQAGPLVPGHGAVTPWETNIPETVLLICSCGAIRRMRVPKAIGRVIGPEDVTLMPSADGVPAEAEAVPA